MHRRQCQYGNGDGRTGHVDGGAERDRHRVGVFVQAQALAQFQVDRDVRCRAAGEEGSDAAFTQAHKHQWIRIATQFPEHDGGVHHQRHEQHAAEQHGQQMCVPDQGTETGGGQGRGHQAEDPQRCEANHHSHDHGDAIGQVAQHFAGGVAGVANGDAHADGPGQNTDEIGVHQCADRVVDHAQQQALQDLADTTGRGHRDVMGR